MTEKHPTPADDTVDPPVGTGEATDGTGDTGNDTIDPTVEPADGTVLIRRTRRTPTLAFWVIVCVGIGAVVGILTGLITGGPSIPALLYFAVIGVLAVGAPLALIASIVDGARAKKRSRKARPPVL
ncbi:MAG: hypothetical protein Q4G40_03065 [Brachybacterium sp.]|nr:hypothetical protein [Brachybacterium sp.]